MKILKRILLFLVVIIALAAIYVAMQPAEYNVQRSKVINAPTASVYATINELRTWEDWGSWYRKDTTIEVSYGEVTSGEGANNSWTSKDGPGKMTTVAAVPNKPIDQEMQFADYDPSVVRWTFEEVEGGTKVTWIMEDDNTPFVFKMGAAMSGGYEAMLAPDMEEGLDNLNVLMTEKMKLENSFRIEEVSVTDLDKKTFIGFKQNTSTEITHEEMTALFMANMPKAGMHAVNNGLVLGDYTPGSVYTKWDEENKEAEFYIGLLLHKNIKAGEGMETLSVPKGKGIKVTKYGKYGIGDMEAHAKIAAFMDANKLEATGLVWELYENDPITVQPQDIRTDIYYLLK
jgi:effector-binding domain-containing protein